MIEVVHGMLLTKSNWCKGIYYETIELLLSKIVKEEKLSLNKK